MIFYIFGAVFVIVALTLFGSSWLSYSYLKSRVLRRRIWDLNICCGKTDGGGINADIVKHKGLPNFTPIEDIYNLPFTSGQFASVLCSHTIEHVDDPKKFFDELSRVGTEVTLLVPPLWDLGAVFNFLEHKWIFMTFRTEHKTLPRYAPLPLARWFQQHFGQRIHA